MFPLWAKNWTDGTPTSMVDSDDFPVNVVGVVLVEVVNLRKVAASYFFSVLVLLLLGGSLLKLFDN